MNWCVTERMLYSDVTLRMLIDDRYCGRVIGREGKTVKKIREDTGTRISISKYESIVMLWWGILSSLFLYVCHSVCLSVCLSVCMSVCLSVCLSGRHLLRNYWTDLAEILHRDRGQSRTLRLVFWPRSSKGSCIPPGERNVVLLGRYCFSLATIIKRLTLL